MGLINLERQEPRTRDNDSPSSQARENDYYRQSTTENLLTYPQEVRFHIPSIGRYHQLSNTSPLSKKLDSNLEISNVSIIKLPNTLISNAPNRNFENMLMAQESNLMKSTIVSRDLDTLHDSGKVRCSLNLALPPPLSDYRKQSFDLQFSHCKSLSPRPKTLESVSDENELEKPKEVVKLNLPKMQSEQIISAKNSIDSSRKNSEKPRKTMSFPRYLSVEGSFSELKPPVLGDPQPTARRAGIRQSIAHLLGQVPQFDEVSDKALELIEDKAYFDEKNSKASNNHYSAPTRRNSIPKLTTILKKHASLAKDPKNNNKIFNFIQALRRKRLKLSQRVLNRIHCWLHGLKKGIKETLHWAKLAMKPFRPDHFLRVSWDILIIVLIMSDLIVSPYRLAFEDQLQRVEHYFNIMDIVFNFFFIIDILLNFHTGFYSDGMLVLGRRKIIKNYLMGWFWIDVIASFPYNLFLNSEGSDDSQSGHSSVVKIMKMLRFLKLLRILRVVKLRSTLGRLCDYIENKPVLNGTLSLIKLCIIVSLLAHWCACGWNLIAINFEAENWMLRFNPQEGGVIDQYIAALYFSLTTMLTVGFGDITPLSTVGRAYTIFIMLLGGGLFGYTMNSIATILQSLEGEKSKIRKKISSLSSYMQKKGLDKEVQNDVKKYLEFLIEGENTMKQNDKEMIALLSEDLRGRVYDQINGRLFYQSKVLTENFSKKILHHISTKIEEKTYVPGECVFDVTDIDFSVYFISKGEIELYFPRGQNPAIKLRKGANFGEVAFFTGMTRNKRAMSVGFSSLLNLKRDNFIEILKDFPIDRESFCSIKDKISIYQNHSSLDLKCIVCRSAAHIVEMCPKIRYVPDKAVIIKDYLEEERVFAAEFRRNNRAKSNIGKSLSLLRERALVAAQMYLKEIQEITEKNKEYCPKSFLDEPENEEGKGFFRQSIKSSNLHGEARRTIKKLSIDKNISRETREMLVNLYNAKLGELEVIRESFKDLDTKTRAELESRTRLNLDKGSPFIEFEDEADFEFDKAANFEIYFPHNNLSKLLDLITRKRRPTIIKLEETERLRIHLQRCFRAIERDESMGKVLSKSPSGKKMGLFAKPEMKKPLDWSPKKKSYFAVQKLSSDGT